MSDHFDDIKGLGSKLLFNSLYKINLNELSFDPDTMYDTVSFEYRRSSGLVMEDLCQNSINNNDMKSITDFTYIGMEDILIEACKYNNSLEDITGWHRRYDCIGGLTYVCMEMRYF